VQYATTAAATTGPDLSWNHPHAIKKGYLYSEDTVTDFCEELNKKKQLRASKKVMKLNQKSGFGTKALSSSGNFRSS
jgi:hypothetical protein